MADESAGAAQKILIKLHEAKKIEGRVSGKQSVYHTLQVHLTQDTARHVY